MSNFIRPLSRRAMIVLLVMLVALMPAALSQPSVQGQWSTLAYQMPINPVHAALLHNGKVLIVAGSGNCPPTQSGCPSGPPYGPTNSSGAAIWDPVAGTITQFTLNWDMFCDGMVVLPDGRVFINGGTIQYDPFHGQSKSSVFDSSTNIFTDVQTMAHGRWYPTVTTLGDGRVMTFSGLDEGGVTNSTVELYTSGIGWSQQYPSPFTPPLYPRMHLLPSGRVFYSGSSTISALFDPSTQNWISNLATTKYGGVRTYGSSVLLPLTPANNYDPKVIIMGGGNPSTATTEIIDLGAATPTWQFGPNMSQPRIEMNATILPNGKILALGGSLNDEDTTTASLNADLYDPTTNKFVSAGANGYARLYHSVALLLPDATVWFAGGNPNRGSYEQHLEIYKPSYLFNSDGTLATRPTLTSAPASIGYGQAFTVQTPDAATISSAVLVRPGSPTHAFDQDQRLVGMSFVQGSGSLTITAPPNGYIVPPGYYMLFLLNGSGVPSVAQMIQMVGSTSPSTLVAAYSFNEGVGTTAGDSSGLFNKGTVTNATWTTSGKYGNALVFNGTNALVTIADAASLDLTSGMTLEAWVNPSTVSSAWRDVIYKGSDVYYLEGTSENGSLPAGGGTWGTGGPLYGTAALTANTWSHVALTYDESNLRLYVNGTQVASQARAGNIATSTIPLQIGGDSLFGQYFQGMIDEVRVYNVALTATQIQSDMNTPIGNVVDTQSPTVPTNLGATAVSSGQINLSWTASTDNVGVTGYLVERCQGTGCSNFAQITTVTGTTYNDTGLTANTSYSYRVRATDAAGNLSPYSNVASGTTLVQDTQPPTAPTNLGAAAISSGQINLGWTASTDNVGVTGYLVERCQGTGCSNFAQITTVTGTTYNNTGLTANTSYSYRVRATDAAGNLSGYSNVASATTQATIAGLVAAYSFNEGVGTAVGDSSGTGNNGTVTNTTWTTSGKYGNALVFNGTNALVTIPDATSLRLTSRMTLEAWVNPSTVSSAWRDVIYKGNDNYYIEGTSSNSSLPAGGGTWGSTHVTMYGTTALTTNTWSHVALTYDGSNLRLYVNGTQVVSQARTGNIATSTSPLQIGGDSLFGQYFQGMIDEVRVYNVALTATQIQSDMNTPIGNVVDTQAPTAPTNLGATAVSSGQINLSWTASTDNVGVTGYLVERCQGTGCSNFAQITTVTGTTYNDTGLTANTSYSYRVRATDAAGNLSGYSNVAGVTTQATSDTQPPTAPTNLGATAISGSQINVSWTASTDNVGVTGYLVERCQGTGCSNFAQITTVTGTTYNDTGLTANTSYSYRVRATDAAGNLSGYSNVASATTLAPTAPTNLAAVGGGPAPVVVAVQSYLNSTFLTSHTTAAFDSTGGDLIVLLASSHFGVMFTPSDNFGNAWISVAGPTNTSLGFDLRTQIWYAPSPIVGPGHTITMNLSQGMSLVMSIIVLKGSNTSSPIDAVSLIGSDNGTQTVNLARPSITTAGKNDLLAAFAKVSAGAVFQSGSGFVPQPGASSNFLDSETGTAANPGTYNATFTLDTPQTWEAAVVAASSSTNQTTLSWTASTETGGTIANYFVERCQGVGCSTFVQVGTTTTTGFNDTSLTANTSYSYRVRAQDTNNNFGPYSSTVSVTIAPAVPSLPGNLTATSPSNTQINLLWSASTETGGTISTYTVQRCQGAGCGNFAQIGSPVTGTTYNDTGLTSGTTYSYRVRAADATGNSSPFSSVASATAQTPDSQAPTAPASLAATPVSSGQISLSWTASTDNVGVTGYFIERCQGAGCTLFFRVAVSTSTTFTDTGLTNGTNYSYRVRATDAQGNLSGYSNVASATAQFVDTQSPTVPTNLGATAVSSGQINLSWTASTDNVGVTGYLVERCQGTGCSNFAQITTVTGTTYNDTTLTANTSYSYRVRATDAAGNLSPYSNVASATTQSISDTQPPTAPTNLGATAISSGQINLSWTASTDNVGVTGYLVERCQGTGCSNFAQITTVTGTTYNNTGLTANTSYSYRVRATDAAGNLSGYSNVASATTQATIAGLVAAYSFNEGVGTAVGDSSGTGNNGTVTNTTWTTSGKYGNALVFNGTNALVTIPDATSLRLTGGMTLEAWVNPSTVSSTWRDVIIKGNDNYYLEGTSSTSSRPAGGGTWGSAHVTIFGTTTLTTNTWSHVALTFDKANLRLYVNGTQVVSQARTGNIATSTSPLQIGGDSLFGQYFQGMIDEVRVYNVALTATQIQSDMNTPIGNVVDTQAPTAPTNLGATAVSSGQINLSWTASTDNVGVTGYLVERCQGTGCSNFAQITTVTGTTYNDTGLTANTSYSYRVRATDAAGNLSGYSNLASATTLVQDIQPPTAPTNLGATAISGSQINLSWTASTDNVGVTGYMIERCQGTGCSNWGRIAIVTGTTYGDAGLIPNTSYSYQVKATDAAGNFSPYSNIATTTTPATIPGLVAAYSFDEGTGTTVTDLSGHGNIGTLTNTTWTSAAKYGNALVFNGTNALVTIPDAASLDLAGGMTLEAWVNPSTVSSAWRDVIYKGNDNYYLEATSGNSSLPAGGGTWGSGGAIYGTTPLTANTWSHVALTYDGVTLQLYVNGTQVGSQARTGNIASSTNPLQIGGDSLFGQYFQGTIDEVRVYNNALNLTQIQSDMATPLGTGGQLPIVSLSRTTINFGNVQTGTTSTQQPVTLTNLGGVQLVINSIAISGGNAGDFAQNNNCGASLTAGASCTINVTFTPTQTGARSSSVVISDNAPGTPHIIALSGTGTGFVVTPRAAALTFTRTQQFTASSGPVNWAVDGIAGGSSAVGTITTTGVYTPPQSVGTHIVTATTTDQLQSASATVYMTNYAGTFTHHNDNLRTGQNTNETVLSVGNVQQTKFGKLFSYTLDGIAFASPLYVANVNIPGQGFHNVVYIATEHDSVYAWDADGLSSSPLWKVNFLGTGITTVPCGDIGECGDIPNEIGITGTPVIDQGSGTLYVVAKTKEGVNYVQRLHALDIATGAEKFGGPVVIQGSVSGSGEGSQGGQLPFDPLKQNQRPALLLNNGILYIGWASHGDQRPWHGWVMAYNASTLQQVMVYCVSPDGYGGGIWASGGGLGTDSTGNIFFNTGNGDFTANTGGRDYGDSVVKVSTSGTVLDYFTPFDQANMESQDLDLASAGPVLLVDQPGSNPHLLITAGKGGTIYVINRDNMGHFRNANDNQIVQSLVGILPHGGLEEGNFSAPAYFNGFVYFAAVNDTLKAFQLSNGLLSTAPASQSLAAYPNRGGAFAVSANGNTNGVIWAVQDNNPANGVLFAYDAGNLGNEFYDSSQAGPRDTLGVASKFSIPLVANGKVFVGAQNQLVAYGLLP